MKRWIGCVLVNGALLGLAALFLFPLAWMLAASLMPTGEASHLPPRLWPSEPSLVHYRYLFEHMDMARYVLNSAILATTTTLLALGVNTLAGYGFAKLSFPGRDSIMRAMLATMVIPGQVAMLPLFFLIKQIGLVNSYAGAIIPGLASVFGIYLVRQYARSIPDSLLDAARVDGASEAQIFWNIGLPLCRPILVTLALFTFLGVWNDFMWPLIILNKDQLYTLPVALANLAGEHTLDSELMLAGSVLTELPVILLFIALQRYYVAGLTQGGMKG